jgi:8-oxo-dGTP pyrophosphatase MutT (NUDIX family)
MKIHDPSVLDPGKPWLKSPFWVTLGGKIEEGEDVLNAARREIVEETGFQEIEVIAAVWYGEQVIEKKGEPIKLLETFVVARTSSASLSPGDESWTPEERSVILEMRWFSLEELERGAEIVLPPVLSKLIRGVAMQTHSGPPRVISLVD